MTMVNVQIDIPEAMTPFMIATDEHSRLLRNALLLYPFISRGEISHGYAANVLGVRKLDLIELYSELGIPYFNQSRDEVLADLETLKALSGSA